VIPLICVDTYGWLERILDGPKAAAYNKVLTSVRPEEVVTSVVTVYELYRKLRPVRGEAAALEAVVHLKATHLVAIDDQIALEAADYSLAHSLHFADALVYATARRFDALLHTSDPNLKSVPGVVFH
jgi:predicted nucleic acid-binding protein